MNEPFLHSYECWGGPYDGEWRTLSGADELRLDVPVHHGFYQLEFNTHLGFMMLTWHQSQGALTDGSD